MCLSDMPKSLIIILLLTSFIKNDISSHSNSDTSLAEYSKNNILINDSNLQILAFFRQIFKNPNLAENTNKEINTNNSNNDINTQESLQPTGAVVIEKNDIILGNPKAKVVIIEYFSPTCPHCFTYHQKIFPLIKTTYIDTYKIAYVMRELISCKQDFEASILARCLKETETYLTLMNIILSKQSKWAYTRNYHKKLCDISVSNNITIDQYNQCLNDHEIINTLKHNTEIGINNIPLSATPSFFLNGNLLTNLNISFQSLSKIIDQELSKH